jgi:hypothetical protein
VKVAERPSWLIALPSITARTRARSRTASCKRLRTTAAHASALPGRAAACPGRRRTAR